MSRKGTNPGVMCEITGGEKKRYAVVFHKDQTPDIKAKGKALVYVYEDRMCLKPELVPGQLNQYKGLIDLTRLKVYGLMD